MTITNSQSAFPVLDPDEIGFIRSITRSQEFADGQTIIKPGDADVDFMVVESGAIDIFNPSTGIAWPSPAHSVFVR